jgi:hypothetical protein
MGFFNSASPSVNFSEVDLTTVVPQVFTTTGAFAGVFRWGPINQALLVDSETTLVSLYGEPTNFNAESWFTCANFLSYGSSLYVSRAANTTDSSGANGALSAYGNTANVSAANALMTVLNSDDYLNKSASFDAGVLYIAKYPGLMGNSLRVSVCDSANQWTSNLTVANVVFTVGSNSQVLIFANNATAVTGFGQLTVGDLLKAGNSTIGYQLLKITSLTSPGVSSSNVNLTTDKVFQLAQTWTANVTSIQRFWEFYNLVSVVPGQSPYVTQFGNTSANDELHVVVVDQAGLFSGVPGTVLEVWENLSRATDAQTSDGSTNYYKTVLNNSSRFVWWAHDRSGAASANAFNVASSTQGDPLSLTFIAGTDGPDETAVTLNDLTNAWNLYISQENFDISLLMTGRNRATVESTSDPTTYGQLFNYIIDNIATVRKDCVAFTSVPKPFVVNNSDGNISGDAATFAGSLRSTSYGFCDSGYKYQYDKYSDLYRYVPLNGDMAGLAVNTDAIRDPWWSFAGYNRGQIKNLIKLAYNPRKSERDILYKASVNPVITEKGQGTLLLGDKTLLNKPSAFSRINVRRLFIVLEKAISLMAKFELFEFNDAFTQAEFRNIVNPYLRDVKGRRGITDFLVVCDDTNNTPDVVDNEQFVGDIYIKPARAINWIQLNFVAVRTGVEFSEIVGKF